MLLDVRFRGAGHRRARAANGILPPEMSRSGPVLGDLQAQIMSALWRLEAGTVEDVRTALPPRYRGAYNTVQTVLNRLAERGLLSRRRRGNAIEYRPKLTEAEFLSRSIASTLAGASSGARQAVLAQLVGELDQRQLDELRRLAKEKRPRRS
jgi:predicted transcriptional regulator